MPIPSTQKLDSCAERRHSDVNVCESPALISSTGGAELMEVEKMIMLLVLENEQTTRIFFHLVSPSTQPNKPPREGWLSLMYVMRLHLLWSVTKFCNSSTQLFHLNLELWKSIRQSLSNSNSANRSFQISAIFYPQLGLPNAVFGFMHQPFQICMHVENEWLPHHGNTTFLGTDM